MTLILVWFKSGTRNLGLITAYSLTLYTFILWFRDINREAAYQGNHTRLVQRGLKWGLAWFLFREVWFFFSVFWRFFHIRTAPLSRAFLLWPYNGILIIPPFQVPLLNTVILLISGVTATLAHHQLLANEQGIWVITRVLLGAYFLSLQAIEYYSASYTLSSRAYGRVFFFGTGFHGLHVCLGAIILLVSSARLSNYSVSSQHHFGLEFSLWYWHFVDVVWLFLFFWVYSWGR